MDEKVRRRQTMACLELAKCNWILRVGKENAHHVGLTGEEVEDCASGFLYKKMKQGLEQALKLRSAPVAAGFPRAGSRPRAAAGGPPRLPP